jgi:excisionase family DNA binding protein
MRVAALVPAPCANTEQRQIRWPFPGPLWSAKGMQAQSATNSPTTLVEDRLLRPEQAAWYLNVKTSWVYEAVRAGRLPCHRVGRHIRFTRKMLDDWLAEQPRR